MEMSDLKVPIIAIIIGEGGSGGALALAVANRVWMLENSIYAVLSPEGFASILWKDGSRAMEAAELMKITSHELLEMGIVDKVISEAGLSSKELLGCVKNELRAELDRLQELPLDQLIEERYQRFRKYQENLKARTFCSSYFDNRAWINMNTLNKKNNQWYILYIALIESLPLGEQE